ncbi:MAG TPA: ferrochelatase [Pyrinomonadaceae bacterium]|nr:ferrochelatase [Pyrinomonadaceae bacterium]
MKRTGVLLINLGTPDAPTPEAVGRYLREFLMDGFVIDVPFPLRWFLVNVVIVPRRKNQSARLYQKIHSEEGSPLLVNTRKLAVEIEQALGDVGDGGEGINGAGAYVVEFAMRYGNPSIGSALARLVSADVQQIIVAPLYPQYAESSFETAVVETRKRASELGCSELLQFLPPFYDQPDFIKACARQGRENLNGDSSEHIVFSFHSLPERHVRRLDESKQHCLVKPDCCDEISSINRNCYRAQCMSTARAIAKELGLTEDRYTVSFQSRLGRAKWLQPVTEEVFRDLARRNVKRVTVFCPSFVADCLETLEEISLRGRKAFIDSGGEKLSLVPAVNAHPQWVKTLAGWIKEANR